MCWITLLYAESALLKHSFLQTFDFVFILEALHKLLKYFSDALK